MRMHVQHQGRNTTVSIDTMLIELLAVKACPPAYLDDHAHRVSASKGLVRAFAEHAPAEPPMGLSQFLQAAIIFAVSDPAVTGAARGIETPFDVGAVIHDFLASEQARMDSIFAKVAAPRLRHRRTSIRG